jgi:hypothetical protein
MIGHEKLLRLYQEYVAQLVVDKPDAAHPLSFDEWYEREFVEKGVMLHRVRWQATFETLVACHIEDIDDAISDIDIPEDENAEYVHGTFEQKSVEHGFY